MHSPMCETILDIIHCDNGKNIITFYLFYSTLILAKCYLPYSMYLLMADNRVNSSSNGLSIELLRSRVQSVADVGDRPGPCLLAGQERKTTSPPPPP